jgi:toluene monooxygenase system protein A
VWDTITERWRQASPGVEFAVHGTAIPGFCSLCQVVLCEGTPDRNEASVLDYHGQRYVFCSEPCRWIFEQEPERYAQGQDVVKRVLAGKAPGNLIEFLSRYSGLQYEVWGKDAFAGDYPWLSRQA